MRRLLVLGIIVSATLAVPFAIGANGAEDGVSIATVAPASGPAGTEIGFTLAGTDAVGTAECLTSSAYRLEFLAPDGALADRRRDRRRATRRSGRRLLDPPRLLRA